MDYVLFLPDLPVSVALFINFFFCSRVFLFKSLFIFSDGLFFFGVLPVRFRLVGLPAREKIIVAGRPSQYDGGTPTGNVLRRACAYGQYGHYNLFFFFTSPRTYVYRRRTWC